MTRHQSNINLRSYPDGNGVELMWDRPFEEWPRDEQGHLAGQGGELNLDDLLGELGR